MNETTRFSIEDHNCKRDLARNDAKILKTYSNGPHTVCLASGVQVVEDVLTSGLFAKLMRFLRVCVLGKITAGQNDACHLSESKSLSGSVSFKKRRRRSRASILTFLASTKPLKWSLMVRGHTHWRLEVP